MQLLYDYKLSIIQIPIIAYFVLARNGCYFNFKPFSKQLLFIVIMHIGNAGKTGTIIVNFQEQPAISITQYIYLELKLKKEEQKIRLILRFFICLLVGFECIRENQTFGQEVLKTLNAKGQGQIQAIGQARIPSTNYGKKYWCFRTKYRLHTHA